MRNPMRNPKRPDHRRATESTTPAGRRTIPPRRTTAGSPLARISPDEEASYAALPPHLRTWPTALPATGAAGFADAATWVQEVGETLSIGSTAKLHELVKEGRIPAVHLADLVGPSGLNIGGRGGDRLMFPKDPQAAQSQVLVRAYAYLRVGEVVRGIPTPVTTTVLTPADQREAEARRAVSAALAKVPANADTSCIRLAWIAIDLPEPKVRVVEYRDRHGALIIPSAKQDLESLVLRQDGTPVYTLEDLHQEAVAMVVRSGGTMATATVVPAPGAPASMPGIATVTPTMGMPLSELKGPALPQPSSGPSSPLTEAVTLRSAIDPLTSPIATRPVAPARSSLGEPGAWSTVTTGGMMSISDVMLQATRDLVHDGAPVTARTGHAVLVTQRPQKFMSEATGGVGRAHAGIQSNWGQFLLTTNKGVMGTGSKVFLAQRTGDTIRIIGTMPYAGLEWGTKPAARLLARVDQFQAFDQPLDFSLEALGMEVPNLPFAISKDITSSGFKVPAQARQDMWKAIHHHLGWPIDS